MVSWLAFALVATSNLLGVVVEMIQIETVRRLLANHEVDTPDIDQMELFKQQIRLSHNTGLQWEQSQR